MIHASFYNCNYRFELCEGTKPNRGILTEHECHRDCGSMFQTLLARPGGEVT